MLPGERHPIPAGSSFVFFVWFVVDSLLFALHMGPKSMVLLRGSHSGTQLLRQPNVFRLASGKEMVRKHTLHGVAWRDVISTPAA